MNIVFIEYKEEYANEALTIWNEIVEQGNAFPQDTAMDLKESIAFFNSQSKTVLALDKDENKILGLYILHPNNVGRCGHICNASYAVTNKARGLGIGRKLVEDCIIRAKALGFRILQFNAVVANNIPALNLYKSLGFKQLGIIPKGFKNKNGDYDDIIPHYIEL